MTLQPATKADEIIRTLTAFFDRTEVSPFEVAKLKRDIESHPDFQERYMFHGMLECHLDNADSCIEYFRKSINLEKSETTFFNYIVALKHLNRFYQAKELSFEAIQYSFSPRSLENLLDTANITFCNKLTSAIWSRVDALSLSEFKEFKSTFGRCENVLKEGLELSTDSIEAYGQLVPQLLEKYRLLKVQGMQVIPDREDEVLYAIYFIRDLYGDDGQTLSAAQDELLDQVIEQGLDSKIVVSLMPGVGD